MCLPVGIADLDMYCNAMRSFVQSALASNTWSKYCTGWRAFKSFEAQAGLCATWPIDIECARAFVLWCLVVRKILPSTIKSYLTSISLAHSILGLKCIDFGKDKLLSMILTGAENCNSFKKPLPNCRGIRVF